MLRPAIRNTYEPFFSNSMYSVFDDLFKNFWEGNPSMKEETSLHSMSTDILDREDHYLLQADLPGFQKEEISIELDQNTLSISAVHNEESEKNENNYLRKERVSRSYKRSFQVSGLDASDIDASYENGVLEVKLPKKQQIEDRPVKRIEVK